jgi:hypothetical protein
MFELWPDQLSVEEVSTRISSWLIHHWLARASILGDVKLYYSMPPGLHYFIEAA